MFSQKSIRLEAIEVGFIIGKNHKFALLLKINKTTLITTINKVNGRDLHQVKNKTIQSLKKYKKDRTIIFHNDKALAL